VKKLPNQFVQNKYHMMKVMFLCAVVRPRFDENWDCYFDGKMGMLPFVEYTLAHRTSENDLLGHWL
jgi:hypothetical protein